VVSMPEAALSATAWADSILNTLATSRGPSALSSENSPIQMTVDGRVERLRVDQVPAKGSCNPPWSSWSD
jgi:hypothetical protein